MSSNAVEKKAMELNRLLREKSRQLDKPSRQRIRSLLGETFAALEARPLDGAHCLELAAQIDQELAKLSGNPTDESQTGELSAPAESRATSANAEPVQTAAVPTQPAPDPEPEPVPDLPTAQDTSECTSETRIEDSGSDERMGEAHSEYVHVEESRIEDSDSDERMGEAHSESPDFSNESDDNSDDPEDLPDAFEPPDVSAPENFEPQLRPFTQMIHLQIRCFVRVKAAIKPTEIGQVAKFATLMGDDVQGRVDKFLAVLSKGEDDFSAKVDLETGYRDDLLPDMPDRNLVLRPKHKKKK